MTPRWTKPEVTAMSSSGWHATNWARTDRRPQAASLIRFGELERRVDGVNQKMLIQQLKELQKDGLVVRTPLSRGAALG